LYAEYPFLNDAHKYLEKYTRQNISDEDCSLKEDKMVKLMIKLIFEKIYFPRKYEGHEYFVGII